MDYLDKLEESFQARLSQIFELSKLPTNILSLLESPLSGIEQSLGSIDGNYTHKTKALNQVKLLQNLSKNKQVQDQFKDFNSQIIVLMIGAMEAHLYDTVEAIGNNNPEMFVFRVNGDKDKKIVFDSGLLSEKTTVGEIMKHYFKEQDGGVSFQDIQSIVRFFAEKLSCDLELDGIQDTLIFATAARNAIIHNNQRIDRRFLTQIRDTAYLDIEIEDDEGKKSKRFSLEERLIIEDADIKSTKEALLSLVSEIGVKIREDDYES